MGNWRRERERWNLECRVLEIDRTGRQDRRPGQEGQDTAPYSTTGQAGPGHDRTGAVRSSRGPLCSPQQSAGGPQVPSNSIGQRRPCVVCGVSAGSLTVPSLAWPSPGPRRSHRAVAHRDDDAGSSSSSALRPSAFVLAIVIPAGYFCLYVSHSGLWILPPSPSAPASFLPPSLPSALMAAAGCPPPAARLPPKSPPSPSQLPLVLPATADAQLTAPLRFPSSRRHYLPLLQARHACVCSNT